MRGGPGLPQKQCLPPAGNNTVLQSPAGPSVLRMDRAGALLGSITLLPLKNHESNQSSRNKQKSVGHNCCFLFGLPSHLANTDTPRQTKIPRVGFLSGVTSGLCLVSKADSYWGVQLHLTSWQTQRLHSKHRGSCMLQVRKGCSTLKPSRKGNVVWVKTPGHLLSSPEVRPAMPQSFLFSMLCRS